MDNVIASDSEAISARR